MNFSTHKNTKTNKAANFINQSTMHSLILNQLLSRFLLLQILHTPFMRPVLALKLFLLLNDQGLDIVVGLPDDFVDNKENGDDEVDQTSNH